MLGQKVAVVTGAAGLIGRAITARLLQDGASVVAVDRDRDALGSLAESIPGPDLAAVTADLADLGSGARIVSAALDRFGRIDALINNAAEHGVREPFLATDLTQWDRIFRTNVTTPAVLSQHAAKDMIRHGGGVIVNVVAIQELLPLATFSGYGASKGALAALTRVLASELGPYGIRVNGVAPGVIHRPTDPAGNIEEATLLGRSGNPEELAAAVAFLASGEASFVTGAVLPVDGGRLISRRYDPLQERFGQLNTQEVR